MTSERGADEQLSDTSGLFDSRFGSARLRGTIEAIRAQTGDNSELARQALADFFALDRQQLRDHFEGRLEYTRHVMAHQETTHKALIEYGLQTLKWSFLLNAGSIAIVLAYLGGAAKSGSSPGMYTPVIKALWPFVAGCVCVLLAGAAGYFNFAFSEGQIPTPEALNNFLPISAKTWPIARAQKLDESPKDFLIATAGKSVSLGTSRLDLHCFQHFVSRPVRLWSCVLLWHTASWRPCNVDTYPINRV